MRSRPLRKGGGEVVRASHGACEKPWRRPGFTSTGATRKTGSIGWKSIDVKRRLSGHPDGSDGGKTGVARRPISAHRACPPSRFAIPFAQIRRAARDQHRTHVRRYRQLWENTIPSKAMHAMYERWTERNMKNILPNSTFGDTVCVRLVAIANGLHDLKFSPFAPMGYAKPRRSLHLSVCRRSHFP